MISVEKKRVLVVDDEDQVRESLRLLLGRHYDVDTARNGEDALNLLTERLSPESGGELPDLVLLDMMMPGIDGLGMLERMSADFPRVPVIMLTGSSTVRLAVQAMKIGAVDYLSKPYDVDELLSLIEETISKGPSGKTRPDAVSTIQHQRSGLAEVPGNFGALVGEHPLMLDLYQKVDQLAGRDTTVLITGESGTGKELIAHEIHKRSPRAAGPYVALNCAAIPESLIESELFGHEKGSFTHAIDKRIGHFELAHGGTLFLDEIGELSPAVQVKMLRFLQSKEFYRVGQSKPTKVDVRIIAATNKNLEAAVKDGSFRQDLYYRIHVVSLEVPPLRERREDIEPLVNFFTTRFAPLYGGRHPQLSPEALEAYKRYSWPGNVRELENVTESVLALSAGESIEFSDLPLRLREGADATTDVKSAVLQGGMPFEEANRLFETELIMRALEQADWIQTKAAEILGISRRILKYKMDKLGISDPRVISEL